MNGKFAPRRVTAALVAVLALVATPAAAAAGAAPDSGDHGAQAQCRYVSADVPGWGAMRLKRLTVQPPTLFAVGSPGKVGWRMIVQRRFDDSAWKRIFTSVTQKRTASPTEAADFDRLSALIDSPVFRPDGKTAYYRLVLRFFWYASDGSVDRVERHLVGHYDALRDGGYVWTDGGNCLHSWLFEE